MDDTSVFNISKFRENPIIKCIIGYDFSINYNHLSEDAKKVILKILLIIDSDLEIHRQKLLEPRDNDKIFSTTKSEYKESLSYIEYTYDKINKKLIKNHHLDYPN
jgi:hypothetical protein